MFVSKNNCIPQIQYNYYTITKQQEKNYHKVNCDLISYKKINNFSVWCSEKLNGFIFIFVKHKIKLLD